MGRSRDRETAPNPEFSAARSSTETTIAFVGDLGIRRLSFGSTGAIPVGRFSEANGPGDTDNGSHVIVGLPRYHGAASTQVPRRVGSRTRTARCVTSPPPPLSSVRRFHRSFTMVADNEHRDGEVSASHNDHIYIYIYM